MASDRRQAVYLPLFGMSLLQKKTHQAAGVIGVGFGKWFCREDTKAMTQAIAGAFSDVVSAQALVNQTGGVLLSATSKETSHLPFAALVVQFSNDEALAKAADVGAYHVAIRSIKNTAFEQLNAQTMPGSVAIYTMVANPDLGAQAADAHWRDNHAPLALRIHTVMTHYYQVSILDVIHGPQWHGFALCCGETDEDLRHRFYDTPEDAATIRDDILLFSDTRASPRRVMARLHPSV